MEATALSVGKSVLHGALSYAKSVLAEEVALQLGVRRDQLFITNELEMMQAFLMSAHDEGGDNKVVKVWVKQVRDVAYDVEDSLQELAVRMQKQKQSWWRVHQTLIDRRRVAKQMKELRANVEDVSQRNIRYHLIKGSASNSTAHMADQSSNTSAALLFDVDAARRATAQTKSKGGDLLQLINGKEDDLRVIAVWGTSADLGQTSMIRTVYEDAHVRSSFSCRAWVRVMRPFDPKYFVQSLVEQFHQTVGVAVLLEREKTAQDLTEEFNGFANKKRYLVVLNDVSTIEEWDRVKRCFPNNGLGSRIVVSTAQVEVASLCAGQESIVSELKQLSADQHVYAFHQKASQDGLDLSATTRSISNRTTASTDRNSIAPTSREISEDLSKGSSGENAVETIFSRIRTMTTAFEESHLVGRDKGKKDIIKLILNEAAQQLEVISVWGMGGLGKTTLVKAVYHNQELNGMFEKCACVTVLRPFVIEKLLRSLIMQLDRESSEKKDVVGLMGGTKSTLLYMPLAALIKEMGRLLERKRCLIVLDDVSSAAEWDMIIPIFREMEHRSRIIVMTREENVAKHCSEKKENIYRLKDLEYKDAHDLFIKKVFMETIDLDKQYPELVEQAKLIVRKCGQLPLAIVTIGGFLANQPKTSLEWRKLNEHISAELEMNQEFGTIRTILMRSFDGLPYHLKSCFLYMPIFPEDHRVGRKRLARRWSAEGYSREVRGKSAEEIADSYFVELIGRSMILPSQQSIHSTNRIDSCQLHDLIHEIGISKSMEENLVFRVEEGCNLNSQATMRHLSISSNWKGDQGEFEGMVDMSRVRSITCFGKWRPFFISERMRLLRVLDLEDSTGLVDHHLQDIGKFLHLRYLSLRGGSGIFHLPDSLGNLRQLQLLDVRGTSILMLPKTITKLRKLQHLHAGNRSVNENVSHEIFLKETPDVMGNVLCHLPCFSVALCIIGCAPRLIDGDDNMNRRDVCTMGCCGMLPAIAMRLDMYGVLLPRGIKKMKSLHTLGVVNIGRWGKDVLKDIRGHTQLRKLGVTGVNNENGQELCSAIVGLSRLESLSIRSEGEPGLYCCLDGTFSFPESLQSLKLYGNLMKLPEWIRGLKNLVKLKLRSSRISKHDDAIQVLGNLPNLASLHLMRESFRTGYGFHLNFPTESFPRLVVLELVSLVVHFQQGATPKVELIKFSYADINSGSLLGLPSLSSLKEVVLQGRYDDSELEYLRAELAENPNRPIVKRV